MKTTTSRSILGNSAAVVIARVAALVCTTIQFPLLTRTFDEREFAIFTAAVGAAAFVNLASGQPFMLAFQRFPGSRKEPSTFRYTKSATMSVLVALAGATALVAPALGFGMLPLGVVVWGAGLAVQNITTTAWLMWHQPLRYAFQMVAVNVIRTGAIVLATVMRGDPASALIAGGLLSAIVGLVTGPEPRALLPRAPRPWPMMFPWTLGVASVALTAFTTGTRILLPHVASDTAAGRFAAMETLARLSVGALIGMMTPSVYPVAMREWNNGDEAAVSRLLLKCLFAVSAVTAVPVVLAPFFAKTVLEAAATDRFADPGYLVANVAVSGLFGFGSILVWVHKFKMQTRYILIVSAGAAIAHLLILGFAVRSGTGALVSLLATAAIYCLALQRFGLQTRSAAVVALGTATYGLAGLASLGWAAAIAAIVLAISGFQLARRSGDRADVVTHA